MTRRETERPVVKSEQPCPREVLQQEKKQQQKHKNLSIRWCLEVRMNPLMSCKQFVAPPSLKFTDELNTIFFYFLCFCRSVYLWLILHNIIESLTVEIPFFFVCVCMTIKPPPGGRGGHTTGSSTMRWITT